MTESKLSAGKVSSYHVELMDKQRSEMELNSKIRRLEGEIEQVSETSLRFLFLLRCLWLENPKPCYYPFITCLNEFPAFCAVHAYLLDLLGYRYLLVTGQSNVFGSVLTKFSSIKNELCNEKISCGKNLTNVYKVLVCFDYVECLTLNKN